MCACSQRRGIQKGAKYVEEQPGNLQVGFGSIHTAAGPYIGWCKGVYVLVENGIMDTVQFGKEAYVYLEESTTEFSSENWTN